MFIQFLPSAILITGGRGQAVHPLFPLLLQLCQLRFQRSYLFLMAVQVPLGAEKVVYVGLLGIGASG